MSEPDSRIRRSYLTVNILKEYHDLLNEEVDDDSTFFVVKEHLATILGCKIKNLVEASHVFKDFDSKMGSSIDEFVSRYDEDIIGDGFSCFTLSDYFELKAKYGLSRLDILTNTFHENSVLTINEINYLIHIFKKLAISIEIANGSI